MKIEVKKYMLSHEGKIYKAGDIVDIEDKQLAKNLVKNSAGSLDFFRGHEYYNAIETSEEDINEIENSDTLPDVDLNAAIDTGKKKGKS